MMLSIHQTVALWDINMHRWLENYLQACAENGGAPPKNLNPFIPWEMSQQRLKELQQSIPVEDTS